MSNEPVVVWGRVSTFLVYGLARPNLESHKILTKQSCQKKLAADENHHLLGWYWPATLLGISLQMAFFK